MTCRRLLPHLTPDRPAIAKFTWPHRPFGGGAGYFLRRDTVEQILAAAQTCPMTHGKEDHYICSLLLNLSIPITNLPLLNQFARDPLPTPSNSIISAHQLPPSSLLSLHHNLLIPPAKP